MGGRIGVVASASGRRCDTRATQSQPVEPAGACEMVRAGAEWASWTTGGALGAELAMAPAGRSIPGCLPPAIGSTPMRHSTELDALGCYSRTLRHLQEQMTTAPTAQHMQAAAAHLDGLAGSEFRRVVPATDRRRLGTFFTGGELRARVVRPHRRAIGAGGMVIDPACGFGDLLLAAAELIPSDWAPQQRIDHLATHLHGRDVLSPLVGIALQRLDLWARAALAATPSDSVIKQMRQPRDYGVVTGDALDGSVDWAAYSIVLLNPPYTSISLDPARSWGGGRVTQAAPFTLDVLQQLEPGTSMAAILPDVLRTGSRYERWRREVERHSEVTDVDVYGKFDRWTDVDVFVLHLKRRDVARTARVPLAHERRAMSISAGAATEYQTQQHAAFMNRSGSTVDASSDADLSAPSGAVVGWWQSAPSAGGVLGGIADISVGDVVPHRHLSDAFSPPEGSSKRRVRYLTIHNLPIGIELTHSPDTVRFHGRTHKGPFVVLRRTSAPSGNTGVPRLRPSIYLGADAVAVENHLIVVKPRSVDVRALAQAMTLPAVTHWLDHRLRLRHLTVTALRQMPVSLLGLEAHDGRGD